MLIVHLSDSHIGHDGTGMKGTVASAKRLEKIVEEINSLPVRPDVALFTGDLTEAGCGESYDYLKSIIEKFAMPCYLTTGNHDSPKTMRDVFNYKSEEPFVQYVVDNYPVRLIALDTHLADSLGGQLDSEKLAWLEEKLAQDKEKPTLIFMHHPPFVSGLAAFDEHLLEGREELGKIIRENRQVKRIICGHLHRAAYVEWNGIVVSSAPSAAAQITPDFRENSGFALTMEVPAYQLHLWKNDTFVSHVCSLQSNSSMPL